MRATLSFVLPFILCACGWQLRGYEQYKISGPQRIESINFVSTTANRLFDAALRQQLEDLSITIDDQSRLSVTVNNEKTERRPLSYGSTGIPIQYQLIMNVSFTYTTPNQPIPRRKTLTARRQYDFDTELLIAKYEEEGNLLHEMRIELVERILTSIQE